MEFKDVEQQVLNFRDERNWKQFHQIKDLLLGLNIEVGELQELYLWKSEQQLAQLDTHKVKDELADIAIFLIYISKHYNINLTQAIADKLLKNAAKYPVDKSKDSNKKYNEL